MPTELETERLRTCTIVRPKGALGTCGWYPKAWTLAVKKAHEPSVVAFLRANPNWTHADIN